MGTSQNGHGYWLGVEGPAQVAVQEKQLLNTEPFQCITITDVPALNSFAWSCYEHLQSLYTPNTRKLLPAEVIKAAGAMARKEHHCPMELGTMDENPWNIQQCSWQRHQQVLG